MNMEDFEDVDVPLVIDTQPEINRIVNLGLHLIYNHPNGDQVEEEVPLSTDEIGFEDPFFPEEELSPGGSPRTGCAKFITELNSRTFEECGTIIQEMTGNEVTPEYFKKNGFNKPILVRDPSGLEMIVPPSNIKWTDILDCIGPDSTVEVIDSRLQMNFVMPLTEFITYMMKPKKTKVLNILSLECEKNKLGAMIVPPLIARQLDWVTHYWPPDRSKPTTQKYCLMGAKGSFTDFHIDFGGSSVWYHILKGEKIFYLIEPSDANLTLFDRWMTSNTHFTSFFGDQVDHCYKLVVRAGNTILLPTGWIHAVYTPEDSLVFGGNFLHSFNIGLQLRVYGLEEKHGIPDKFRFPEYETLNLFAAKGLMTDLAIMNNSNVVAPPYYRSGLRELYSCLKNWYSREAIRKKMSEEIFEDLATICPRLSREVRRADRLFSLVNPPKKERESKRPRKKPSNADYIEYDSRKPSIIREERVRKRSSKDALFKENHHSKSDIPKQEPLISVKEDEEEDDDNEEEDEDFVQHSEGSGSTDKAPPQYNNTGNENWLIRMGGSKLYLKKQDAGTKEESSEGDKAVIDSIWSDPLHYNEKLSNLPLYGPNSVVPEEERTKSPQKRSLQQPSEEEPGEKKPKDPFTGVLNIDGKIYPYTASKNQGNPQTFEYIEDPVFTEDVHQDDEFIYPSLDYSSEEEVTPVKKRKKSGDEAWNPRGKLNNITPKTDRPMREGKQKKSVMKGLEAAAKRTPTTDAPKRPQVARKKKLSSKKPVTMTTVISKILSPQVAPPQPSTSTYQDCKLLSPTKMTLCKKPKKGFATPKQRLSKILKLHKLMH